MVRPKSTYRQLEDVLGCKWSVSVLAAIAAGVTRPGALERHIEGISTKVLNERLRKLAAFGLVERRVFDERPYRTEYALTDAGARVARIVVQVRALDDELRVAREGSVPGAHRETSTRRSGR